MFIQLPPADDGAVVSGRRLRARRRQAGGPQASVQRQGVHAQQRYVVPEAARRVAGVQDHLAYAGHALPRPARPRAATQRAEPGHPVGFRGSGMYRKSALEVS